MESVNRLELEREWLDASKQADHWVDVISDLRRQIKMADTLQARYENALSEFLTANAKVRELSKRLANL